MNIYFKTMNLKEAQIFDMSNLRPAKTGLPFQVWYGPKVPAHKPRIIVIFPEGKDLSVEIESHKVTGDSRIVSKKDLKLLFEWIDLNKDILLDYWNNAYSGSIDSGDVSDAIKKVEG